MSEPEQLTPEQLVTVARWEREKVARQAIYDRGNGADRIRPGRLHAYPREGNRGGTGIVIYANDQKHYLDKPELQTAIDLLTAIVRHVEEVEDLDREATVSGGG